MWRSGWFVLCLAALAASCSNGVRHDPPRQNSLQSDVPLDPADVDIVDRDDWGRFFGEVGLTGTFALSEIGTGQIHVFNETRSREPMIPASTFKILSSMIFLETGVIPDVDTDLPWDGINRGPAEWNRDHSLRSGIEYSAVWMYQDLARKVGTTRMQHWVTSADYGNNNIGGQLDRFWLDGEMRISAVEQVDFLQRFVASELPFSQATQDSVREILVRESGPNWNWSYKTGLGRTSGLDLGWIVGIVDRGDTTWVFALNVDMPASQPDLNVRQGLARGILEAEEVLPT